MRIYSTSGTTGAPSYIPLTADDVENWLVGSSRSYAASGVEPGQRIVSTYNAGPFVAGAALAAFERIGLVHIPVGTGNTALLVRAIETLEPQAVVMTPSYAAYLAENHDLRDSSVERVLVAGEPGGGEPAFRAKLEEVWGAKVTEAMGVGDIGPSLFGECEQQNGMHLGAHGFVHLELIDPDDRARRASSTTAPRASSCSRTSGIGRPRSCASATRDHVTVMTSPCPCGREGPRIRCIGRTDDMLIVRGVNVFPSAVREVVNTFAPEVSGHILVRPRSSGVKQEPPLPLSVELARGAAPTDRLSDAIGDKLREELTVRAEIELVEFGTLSRSEYKSKLVEEPA